MSKAVEGKVHGLFPVEGDAEAPEVHQITIIRLLDGGRTQTYPLPVLADDCPDLQALYHLMGGGVFEVQAKNEKGRIVTRRKYEFEGPPKPLPPVPGQVTATAAAPVQQVVQQQPAQQAPGIDLAAIIVALISTSAQTQAQMFTAMSTMVAALAGKGGGASGESQLVQALVPLLQSKMGGGGLKVEDVFKLLGKGAEIAADKMGDDEGSPDATLGNLTTILGSVTKLAELGGGPAPNVPGAVTA